MNNSIIVVNIENGPVLIPETKIGNFTLQECLANAENGTCIIPTSEERKLEIHFHEQIDVEPPTNMECIETPQWSTKQTFCDIKKSIRTKHLNQEEKEVIIPLCKKYKNIFYNGNNDLYFTSAVKHHIKTDDDEPIYTKSYKYPYHLKEEIQTEIKKTS